MRIVIDGRWIIREPSGISHYTLNLVRALARRDPHSEYFLLFQDQSIANEIMNSRDLCTCSNLSPVRVRSSVFSALSQFEVPMLLRKLKADIFHSTNFMAPLVVFGTRLVVTIHDLIPFLFPHFAPRSKKSRFYPAYRLLMQWIVRRADAIIVDSSNSYLDLSGSFPRAAAKTSVIPFGVDPSFHSGSEERSGRIRRRWDLDGEIILYVGRQDPYKNVAGLIEIFSRVVRKRPGARLVIAGAEDPRYCEISRAIQDLNLADKVVVTGFLRQEELVDLYREASCVVLPSLYEGFGLPVLEAFTIGAPVVASNAASIPEIAGEAALLLDPKKPELWDDAIVQVLSDPRMRGSLVERGKARARSFSWEIAAGKILEIYRRLMDVQDMDGPASAGCS